MLAIIIATIYLMSGTLNLLSHWLLKKASIYTYNYVHFMHEEIVAQKVNKFSQCHKAGQLPTLGSNHISSDSKTWNPHMCFFSTPSHIPPQQIWAIIYQLLSQTLVYIVPGKYQTLNNNDK